MTTASFNNIGIAKVITVIDSFLIIFSKLKKPEEKK